jgi:hypothetical protein
MALAERRDGENHMHMIMIRLGISTAVAFDQNTNGRAGV